MTIVNKLTFSILIICLSCFVFNCTHKHNKKSSCSGFQDSLLHKFVYKTVDSSPQPEGGMETITKLLSKNFKYPPGDTYYSGRVIVAFVVEIDGKIDGERTIYDPSGNEHLFSKQLLNIVNGVKWKAGLCNGEAVPCLYTFPLNVDIQE
jgi:hypothetical protein